MENKSSPESSDIFKSIMNELEIEDSSSSVNEEQNDLPAPDQQYINKLAAELRSVETEGIMLRAKKRELEITNEKLRKSLEIRLEANKKLNDELTQERQKLHKETLEYVDILREKASVFRKMVYNEDAIKEETAKVERNIAELKKVLAKQQAIIEEKKRELNSIRADDMPQDIRDILENKDLDDKIEALIKQEEALEKKRISLLKKE